MTDQGRSIPTASAVKTVPAAGAALATENGSRAGLRADLPVGVFDSGVGGISVLRRLVDQLPGEDFCFFGDSANAPYGTRPPRQVLDLSRTIVGRFLAMPVKAIVIACNTATSAAAATLRAEHPGLPIIGIEPAVKPALEYVRAHGGDVVVMATPLTLREKKFSDLLDRLGAGLRVHRLPAPDLVEAVEAGKNEDPATEEYLRGLLAPYLPTMGALVLGCTHYPFALPLFEKILGPDIPVYDGARGVARQLRRELAAHDLLRGRDGGGHVSFASSLRGKAPIDLSERLFSMDLDRWPSVNPDWR